MTTEQAPKEQAANPTRGLVARRRPITLVFLFLALILVAAKLVWIQVIQGPSLAAEAQRARTSMQTIVAPRGKILDSHGEILAVSIERYDIGARPDAVAKYEFKEDGEVKGTGVLEAARQLAPILEMSEAEVGGLLVGDGFRYIARDVTPDKKAEIDKLKIPGIEADRLSARYYPNGSTAGNVVGFTNAEGVGAAGIEQVYNEILTGEDGFVSSERGTGGQLIPGGEWTETAAVPGSDITLTIDRDLQFVAQTAVDEAKARRGAQWAAAVVEEIGTGRILALADSDSVDPNNVGESEEQNRGARSVTAPFEPGSTGKLITFAAGLDQGTVDPMTEFTIPDRITMPNGQSFSDNDEHPTWRMYMSGVVANSLNTGTVQIGDTMSDERRYKYMQDFGLGAPTGIEMPSESVGQLRTPYKWDGRQRYTTMFGQGYSATLLQLNSMVATIGNSGVRVKPHLIDSITYPDGKIEATPADAGYQVISAEAAHNLIAMMEGVTGEGATGILGRVPGYRVAAKTGTAQIADASGGLGGRLGSFVGLIPAENPRLAISVVVYQPSGIPYGGVVAAPVFSDIAAYAMTALNVPPSTEPAPNLRWSPNMPNPGSEEQGTGNLVQLEAVPQEELQRRQEELARKEPPGAAPGGAGGEQSDQATP